MSDNSLILRWVVLSIVFLFTFQSYSKGISYTSVIRTNNGDALANAKVQLVASILIENKEIYRESHDTYSDSHGLIMLSICDGTPIFGDKNLIDWTKKVKLRISATIDNNEKIIGESQICGVPMSLYSDTSSGLQRYSSTGELWNLQINNAGDLSWKKISPINPNYDREKWPQQLYLVGDFVNWDPALSIPFQKVSNGIYSLTYHIQKGAVIKFIQVQSWQGKIDWSGTSGKSEAKELIKEWGDTPPFEGDNGEYKITVDFSNFTLLIQSIN